MGGESQLLVCSHRGPLTHQEVDGRIEARRGSGGLVTALSGLLRAGAGVSWLACALSDADREVAHGRRPAAGRGVRARLLDVPRDVHRRFYEDACVTGLGFLFHGLVDQAYSPTYDARWRRAWAAYQEVNRAFAEAAAQMAGGGPILVEDYHLMRLADGLRALEPARTEPVAYFHHVPWCSPAYFGLLPRQLRVDILAKVLQFDSVGFHARRWADEFLACCDVFLPGAHCDADSVKWQGREVSIVVAPAQLDVPHVREVAASAEAARWRESMQALVRRRRVVARVDRVDLWKNIRRGFLAFERAVVDHSADDVVFLALLAKSRMQLAEYREHLDVCIRSAQEVNRRLNPRGEGPIHVLLAEHSDHSRALAVLSLADVVLVNSTSDGLNLVAKESVLAAEGRSRLVLTERAGVYEEIGQWAYGVNPFDVEETAEAIAGALEQDEPRSELWDAVRRNSPEEWLRRRLGARRPPGSGWTVPNLESIDGPKDLASPDGR